MSKKWQNLFLILGIAAIVVMLLTFDINYRELWTNILNAGWWFAAVLGLWAVIYLLNTLSWNSLLSASRDANGNDRKVGFWLMYKFTVTGFALNDATPCGLMGGEPYRIMELTPLVGGVRATSSVVAYTMMHVFCHICFWTLSAIVFLLVYDLKGWIVWFSIATIVICSCLIYLFLIGYKHGIAKKLVLLLCKVPFIKGKMTSIYEKHEAAFDRVDQQISALHGERRGTFVKSFMFEFISRCLTSVEVYFVLQAVNSDASMLDCVMIMAFTSLLSNLFFFLPMQLGAREGGFAAAIKGFAMTGGVGVFVGLICRVRELLCIAIGVALMKVGNHTVSKSGD